MQDARRRPRRLHFGQCLRRAVGDVLELEGDDVDVVGEGGERLFVVIGGDGGDRRHLRRRRVMLRGEHMRAEAQPRRRQRRHAAELAAPEDADGGTGREALTLVRAHALPSGMAAGLLATAAVRAARQASSARAILASLNASTAVASSAALMAPGSPIASVPTGTPAGIWAMERRLSRPLSALLSTGTPKTGSGVSEATMPGRWAAPPAPAMIALRPRPRAASA